jgi:hypothetical protein
VLKSLDFKIFHIEGGVTMQPMDTQGRRRLAAERFEFLRDDARSSLTARRVRPRFGGLFGSLTVRLRIAVC